MKRFFVTIPKPWASFRFDCRTKEQAVAFFVKSAAAKGAKFASLYQGNKQDANRIARIEDYKLVRRTK